MRGFQAILFLVSLLGCAIHIAYGQSCSNSRTERVRFREGQAYRNRQCSWFLAVSSRQRYCTSRDVGRNRPVWKTCQKECPNQSRCGLTVKPPVKSPTPKPVPKSPTKAPIKFPTKSPVKKPTIAPLTPPTPSFGPYPAGPYISVQKNSERIALPEPSKPSTSSVSNCPHTRTGVVYWDDASIWGASGVPQRIGQNVTVPRGRRVVIRRTIPVVLGVVTVPAGSDLIIGSNVNGIDVHVAGMEVAGRLIVGSETCRLGTRATITLHGRRPRNAVTNVPAASYKGIHVTGVLSLHGKRYFHTWSRLAKTAEAGSSVLMLQNPVNWEAGQEVVIVTSAIKDSIEYHQNEVRTVRAVHTSPPSGVGAIVYLTEPVDYSHIANSNYQVEVGLLTRTVKVQGSESDSEPTDPDPLSCTTPLDNWWWIQSFTGQPCENKELTGFGGHIIVRGGGRGYVEGVELYRMGQTNLLGRYPIHFHMLGDCPDCYVKDSSIHRSYYRCVSIHGTHYTTTTENVAYDVRGYCYYLEDGVEQFNTLSYNLAAHIHSIGPVPWGGGGQTTDIFQQSATLTLPADVTASGFYITNVHNHIIGNAASGGWAGFAFPNLAEAIGAHRGREAFRPSTVTGLTLDGNTAHSTGWWWKHAGAFYFGGSLYYNGDVLEYNPGRSFSFERDDRRTCKVNNCAPPYSDCVYGCPQDEVDWLRITNSKAFLTAGVGLNSWSGQMEVIGFESHDNSLAMEALSGGFWINNLLAVCRTGESLGLPEGATNNRPLEGSGFFWYDTGQEHIITQSTFRNCGFRSNKYNQYDSSATRGCDDSNTSKACYSESSTFGFLTHSDEFTPEIMQGTRDITFDNCGRRFKFTMDKLETVSGRGQNWLDMDGSVSGLNEPTIIASGLELAKDWWGIDDQVVYEPQAPLRFIKKNNGPIRSMGHVRMSWDESLHNQVGSTYCRNDGSGLDCSAVGYMRHLGHKFSPTLNAAVNKGLPVTANPDVVGMIGGFGWLLTLNRGAPRKLVFWDLEVDPGSVLLLSIPYPAGTTFNIRASAPSWCGDSDGFVCNTDFVPVSSVQAVRNSAGNTYHVGANGVLTLRIVQFSGQFTGNPNWILPNYNTPGRWNEKAISKFERDGVVLPMQDWGITLTISANCGGSGVYCSGSVAAYDPDVCNSGFVQVAYDTCCQRSNLSRCMFANGSRNF